MLTREVRSAVGHLALSFETAAVSKNGVPLGGAGRREKKCDEEKKNLAASDDHLVAVFFFFPSFIEVELTNKIIRYLKCAMW